MNSIVARPTRERLIRAAVYHFQEMGYHGTGITAILQRAKAPKGSFYHHFPGGKEQMAGESIVWLQDQVETFLDGIAAEGGGAALMVERLAAFSVEGLRRNRTSRGSLIAVLAQDAAPDSAVVAAALRTYVHSIRSRISKIRDYEMRLGDGGTFSEDALAIIQGAVVLARIEARPELALQIVRRWLQTQPRSAATVARKERNVR